MLGGSRRMWDETRTAIAASCLLALSGCVADGESREDPSNDVVIGSVSDPLSSGTVRWVNGTYTSCVSRSGAWSARVSGADAMDNPGLSVVKDDVGCKLTLTGLVADQAYSASTPIALSTSYAAVPSTFGTGPSQFLGNARLESTAFASDFQLTFVYAGGSDPPPVSTATVNGGYATVQSSIAMTVIPASTYSLDISELRFQADVLQLFVGITGYAVLVTGLVSGSSYVIESGTLGATPTYAQTGTAYDGAVSTQKTISGTNPTIQASEFNILTLSILGSTQVRNVIVKRTVAGIAAYQIFRVTFIS